MNKLIAAAAVALVTVCVNAEEEELFVKPNSSVGYVAVINKQTRVDEKEFVAATEVIRAASRIVFKFSSDDAIANGATAVIRVIDDENEPPMTVSPEAGRGILNVGALVKGLSSETSKKKFLPGRARREFLRTVAYAFCAGGTQFPGNIMCATEVRDLDYFGDFLPVDSLQGIVKNAEKRGMKPEYATDYYSACQEGWAPKPVTPEQRKAWDEVHEIPTNPMTIKFDPKTDTK